MKTFKQFITEGISDVPSSAFWDQLRADIIQRKKIAGAYSLKGKFIPDTSICTEIVIIDDGGNTFFFKKLPNSKELVRHRVGGPAAIFTNDQHYYIYGKQLNENDYWNHPLILAWREGIDADGMTSI